MSTYDNLKQKGNNMTMVDLEKLLEEGIVDLDTMYIGANWELVEVVGYYTVHDLESGPLKYCVEIHKATIAGVTAYRWIEILDGDISDQGEINLSIDEVMQSAQKYFIYNKIKSS